MLLPARPFEHHRPAGERAGNERRIEGGVVRAVMAVAAGPRRMDGADRPGLHAERLRQRGAQDIDALAVGMDGQQAVGEVRHSRRRAERAVHLVGPLVARFERGGAIGRRRHRRLDRSAVDNREAHPFVVAEGVVDIAGREPAAHIP